MKKLLTILLVLFSFTAMAQPCADEDTVRSNAVSLITATTVRVNGSISHFTSGYTTLYMIYVRVGQTDTATASGVSPLRNLTGLQPNTQYYYYYKTICVSGTNRQIGPYYFTTAVNTIAYATERSTVFPYFKVDSGLKAPRADTSLYRAPGTSGGDIMFKTSDSTMYYYNGVRWTPMAVDSSGMLARLDEKVDSVTVDNINNRLYYWKQGVSYGYDLPLGTDSLAVLSTVTQISSLSRTNINQLVVTDTIRGGNFNLYAGSDPVDGGIVFSDALGRKWMRQWDRAGYINVQWFGLVADGVTDNYAAWESMMAYLIRNRIGSFVPDPTFQYASQLHNIYFPPNFNYYYFSRTLNLNYNMRIEGASSYSGNWTSRLSFPADSVGIRIGGFFESTPGSVGTIIKNLFIYGLYDATFDTTAHGFDIHAPVAFENVGGADFGGNIFNVNVTAGGTANLSYFDRCYATLGYNGFYIAGADANICEFHMCNSFTNRKANFWDGSFLGNHYVDCHSAAAALTYGQKTYVLHRPFGVGITYEYAALHDGFLSIPGESVGWEDDWARVADSTGYYWGAGGAYNPATYYWVSGGFMMDWGRLGGENQKTTLTDCYAEGGQMPNFVGGRSTVIGGNYSNGWYRKVAQVDGNNGDVSVPYSDIVVGTLNTNNVSRINKRYIQVQTDSGAISLVFENTYKMAAFKEGFSSNSTTFITSGNSNPAPWLRNELSASTLLSLRGYYSASWDDASKTRKIIYGGAVPSSGTWTAGDLVINNNPTAGVVYGWRCILLGTPGTWETLTFGTVTPYVDTIYRVAGVDSIYWKKNGITFAFKDSVGAGGSGTVNSGTQYRLAYYATAGTAVSEAAAITASRALVSDANGVPTHATTTATEIGYVNGVTSAIQTQLNGKQSTITFGTGVQTALGVNIGSAGAPVLFNGAGGTPSSLTGTNITGVPLTTGLTGGNWKTIYTNGSGVITELALGTSGQVLTSNGTTSAPTWETPSAGSGLTVGTSAITSGTASRLLYETTGNVLGEVTGATSDGTKLILTKPSIDNIEGAYATTATAAGTTTLTVSSKFYQNFTGSTTQTVVMPDATTLTAGMQFQVNNNSTGVVTVNANGGTLLRTIGAGNSATFTVTDVSTSTGVYTVSSSVEDWSWIKQSATYTLTSTTSSQKLFNASTNGAFTVEAGTTYFFECLINLSSMSATSGNTKFDILGAGTATFTSVGWSAIGNDNTTPGTSATSSGSYTAASISTSNIVAAATGTGMWAKIEGIMVVNAGGTIIPSVALITAAAAVVGVNTHFKIRKVGTGNTYGNFN